MGRATVRSASEERAHSPAAEPAARKSAAAALVDLSPRGAQMRSLASASTAAAQLKLQTKSAEGGRKVDGSPTSIKKEVKETIARNGAGEILEDIAALTTSIEVRTQEQTKFKSGTAAHEEHEGRIALETEQRALLQEAYDAIRAKKQEAKAAAPAPASNTDDDGFTTVKRGGKK